MIDEKLPRRVLAENEWIPITEAAVVEEHDARGHCCPDCTFELRVCFEHTGFMEVDVVPLGVYNVLQEAGWRCRRVASLAQTFAERRPRPSRCVSVDGCYRRARNGRDGTSGRSSHIDVLPDSMPHGLVHLDNGI